jgi:hypothetical protein
MIPNENQKILRHILYYRKEVVRGSGDRLERIAVGERRCGYPRPEKRLKINIL